MYLVTERYMIPKSRLPPNHEKADHLLPLLLILRGYSFLPLPPLPFVHDPPSGTIMTATHGPGLW